MRRGSASALFAVVLLVLSLVGCAADQTESQVRTLTRTFFSYLKAGDSAKAAALVDGGGGTMQPLLRAAEEQKNLIPSYSIQRIHRVDSNTQQVFVEIPGTDTTTTIALVARRSGETWKFDSTIQVETRLNTIVRADDQTGAEAGK